MGGSECEQVRVTNIVFGAAVVNTMLEHVELSSVRRENPSPKSKDQVRAHAPERTNARRHVTGRAPRAALPSRRGDSWVSAFLLPSLI